MTGSLVLKWEWSEPDFGRLIVSAHHNGFAGRAIGWLDTDYIRSALGPIAARPWSADDPWEISTSCGRADGSSYDTIRLVGYPVSKKGQLRVSVELFDDLEGNKTYLNIPTSYSAATTFAHQLGHAIDTKHGTAELTADVLE